MSTHRIRKGEGQGGVLLRCLIEALVENNALKGEKWDAVRLSYMTKVNASPEGKRHPDVYFRHVGEICKDLDPNPPVTLSTGGGLNVTIPAAVAAPAPVVAAAAPPEPPPLTDSQRDLATLGLSIEDIGLDEPIEECPFKKAGGPLEQAMKDLCSKGAKFPFFRVVTIEGTRYAIAGLARSENKETGGQLNVGATHGNLATLAKATDKIAVFWHGRAVVLSHVAVVDNAKVTYFVRLLHHVPNREIRMWINRKGKDGVEGDMTPARITMDDTEIGFTFKTSAKPKPTKDTNGTTQPTV